MRKVLMAVLFLACSVSAQVVNPSVLPGTPGNCGKYAASGTQITDAGAACGSGSGGLSGMTAGQIPVAATATTVTSSVATTGSGNVVLATSPTLATPNLGTPSAIVATNASGTAAALNIGGTAATATALASTPSLCPTGQAPTGVLANGNATGCASSVPNPSANGVVQCTGTNCSTSSVLTIGGASGNVALVGSTPAQFQWQWSPGNTLGSSTVMYGPLPFATAVSIPANGTDSNGFSSFYLGTSPAATWVATIYSLPYNGSGNPACSGTPASIGTISVSTSNIATFTITATNFSKGDCYEVVAPSSVDEKAATPFMTQYLLK